MGDALGVRILFAKVVLPSHFILLCGFVHVIADDLKEAARLCFILEAELIVLACQSKKVPIFEFGGFRTCITKTKNSTLHFSRHFLRIVPSARVFHPLKTRFEICVNTVVYKGQQRIMQVMLD
jgi:hypothetical protein